MLTQELREQVFRLPVSDRLQLVKDIIDSVHENPSSSQTERAAAFQRLKGLLKTESPTPTDEEVEAMLEEHRVEKFST